MRCRERAVAKSNVGRGHRGRNRKPDQLTALRAAKYRRAAGRAWEGHAYTKLGGELAPFFGLFAPFDKMNGWPWEQRARWRETALLFSAAMVEAGDL